MTKAKITEQFNNTQTGKQYTEHQLRKTSLWTPALVMGPTFMPRPEFFSKTLSVQDPQYKTTQPIKSLCSKQSVPP